MNYKLIFNVITRPNSCFEEIAQDFSPHYRQALAIFAIAGLVVIFPNLVEMNQWGGPSEQDLLLMKSVSLVMRIVISIIQNFVLIYAIYWVGQKLGGNASYGKAVTILSFCLIPSIISAIGLGVATSFTTNYLYMEDAGNSLDFDQDLSQSYVVDFFSSSIMSYAFAVFFGGWTLLLLVKATRILNGFSLKNTIITIVAAICILFFIHIVFGAAMGVLGALSRFF
ncbi:MAG: YIP1 family protein [Nitrosopumilus sp.]|nr:YIP1 family protein [Nitrosopumilus sp.]